METIKRTYNVYSFAELSTEAKEKAMQEYLQHDIYFWHDENQKSLNEFCKVFSIKIKDFEYGYRKFIDWEFESEDELLDTKNNELIAGNELLEYLKQFENILNPDKLCPLTGYCVDEALLQPLRDFINNPNARDIGDLFNFCLQAWLSDCEKDYEYTQSEEYLQEHFDANEYKFLEDGTMFN